MKTFKKNYLFINIVIILILSILILTGCEREEKVSKVPPPKTIGVSIACMEDVNAPFIKEAMEDLKERNNIKLIWLDSGEDEKKEKENLRKLLEENVDAIIIQPIKSQNEKIKEIVKEIKEKKIPLIAIDRIIEDTELCAYVTSNNFQLGIEQARYLTEQIKNEGQILLLKGDQEDNVAIEINAGNMEILRKTMKIDIIAEEWHKDWSAELAENTVRKTLEKYPDLKGILASNSEMAMAAVKVLKEKNLIDKVITVGADASKEACLAIAREELDADVDKMPYILGMVTFKIAANLAREETWAYDKEIENGEHKVPVKVTPIMLIDKYNLVTMRYRWPELNEYIKTVK